MVYLMWQWGVYHGAEVCELVGTFLLDKISVKHDRDDYGCSFLAKLSRKKNYFFFEKIYVFFTKYTLIAEKMFSYGKKSFILKNFFSEKNFFTEKNINVTNYVSHLRNIFLCRKCLCY